MDRWRSSSEENESFKKLVLEADLENKRIDKIRNEKTIRRRKDHMEHHSEINN
jgi:hypothetical protein